MYRNRLEQRLLLSVLFALFTFTLFVAMLFALLGWLQANGSSETAVLQAVQLITTDSLIG